MVLELVVRTEVLLAIATQDNGVCSILVRGDSMGAFIYIGLLSAIDHSQLVRSEVRTECRYVKWGEVACTGGLPMMPSRNAAASTSHQLHMSSAVDQV